MKDIVELKAELLEKKTKHFYVFIGDEIVLQDVYIKKISEVSGLDIEVADNVQGLLSVLTATSLFKMTPKVYVIRNDEDYAKSKGWENLLKQKDFQDNILILRYSTLEKSSKFCKEHGDYVTQFDYIGGTHLRNRIHAITDLPIPDCDDLVRICGNNYGRIQNELKKLQTYARLLNTSWDIAYIRARKNKLIHEEIGDVIFDFTDAIIMRNITKAYELYDKLIQTDDNAAIKILSILYNSFRQILTVQCTLPKERTEQALGLTSAQIFIATQKSGKYSLMELAEIIKLIRKLEKGIKTGTVDTNFAIQYFMGMIW